MRIYLYILIIITLTVNDAYSQWKKVESIPPAFANAYWLDVYFLESNPLFGWICGQSANIIKTTDGGLTWTGTRLQQMKIDSVINGNTTIYDTTFNNYFCDLESIHFVNEKVGYASGQVQFDVIFKTTDGGSSWNRISDTSINVWGVYFITQDTGLAVGGGCDNGIQSFNRTTDGGISWNTFSTNEIESGLSDAILYSPDGLGFASSSGFIWITKNGGISWDTLSSTGTKHWQEEITNIGNSFLIPYALGCKGGGILDVKGGGIRMSTDFGKNWLDFNTRKKMFGAFLIDSSRGWACGYSGSVFYTSNGGKNWELRNCGVDTNNHLDDIWFINDTLGWVVGDSSVYQTFYYDTSKANIISDKPLIICEGDSLKLESDKDFQYYRWSTGDTTKYIYSKSSGSYSLEAFNSYCEFRIHDSLNVIVIPKSNFEIFANKPLEFCEGDSIKLWVNLNHKGLTWSTNETTDTIVVKKSGKYFVTLLDTNGCVSTNEIEVIVHELPLPVIQESGRLHFCDGDSVKISTTEKFFDYSWFELSNPNIIISKDDSIIVTNPGNYAVIVKNDFGCRDTSNIIDIEVLYSSKSLEIYSGINNKYIDFDTVSLRAILCKDLNFKNLTSFPISINNIFVFGNTEFSVPQTKLPFVIFPDSIIKLPVCFRPVLPELMRDTLIIKDSCSDYMIPLFGVGSNNIYTAQTDCNVRLKFVTDTLTDKQYFVYDTPYPNPSNGSIYLNIQNEPDSNPINLNVSLFDRFGKSVNAIVEMNNAVSNKDSNLLQIKVNANNVTNGMYYLRLNRSEKIMVFPILICK